MIKLKLANHYFNIDCIISFLIVFFSIQFLVGLTQFSPIYFAYCLVFFLAFFKLVVVHKLKLEFNLSFLLAITISIYLIWTQNGSTNPGGYKDIFLKILELVIFVLSSIFLKKCPIDFILKLVIYFLNISIVFLFLDFMYRFSHVGINLSDFYLYKYNSLMFEDSNFVGLMIVTLFSLGLFFHKYYQLKISKQLVLLFIFCLLTFSRTSILAIIFSFFLYKFWNGKISLKFLVIFFVITITLYFILEDFFITDGSLLIRLRIIDTIFDFLSQLEDHLFYYGNGIGTTKEVIGKSAHNIILTYLIEIGLCGSLLYLGLWVSFIIKNVRTLFVILPVCINCMAVEGIMPYFYVCISLILVCDGKFKKKNKILNNRSCLQC